MSQKISYEYLIVGGGIAGVTAAEAIREEHPTGTIGIISHEPYPLYSRVLIPLFLKNKISREKIFLRTSEKFIREGIDLHLSQKILGIDTTNKEVHCKSGFVFRYQKLLLASGGRPKNWGTEENQNFVFYIQDLQGAERLKEALPRIRHPLVIGSSFIALEFLEIFYEAQSIPVLVAKDPYFFGQFLDAKGGDIIEGILERHGIRTYYNDSVKEISSKDGEFVAETQRLIQVPGDALAVGIGLERNLDFVKNTPIKLGEAGVLTDEYLETSIKGIFAAGDVAEYRNLISDGYSITGNWTTSFLQGKQAGLNMAGKREKFSFIPFYSVSNFGMQLTVLGETAEGIQAESRADLSKEKYERFFIKEGKLTGAVLINSFENRANVVKLMESKISIEPYRERLRDVTFNLQTISDRF